MAKYLVTGGLNGMWHKKKAEDIVPGGGGGGDLIIEPTVDTSGKDPQISITLSDFTKIKEAYDSGRTVKLKIVDGSGASYAILSEARWDNDTHDENAVYAYFYTLYPNDSGIEVTTLEFYHEIVTSRVGDYNIAYGD